MDQRIQIAQAVAGTAVDVTQQTATTTRNREDTDGLLPTAEAVAKKPAFPTAKAVDSQNPSSSSSFLCNFSFVASNPSHSASPSRSQTGTGWCLFPSTTPHLRCGTHCSKIRRQIEELERVSGVVAGGLTVDGVPVDSYLTRFVWDEAKYPTMSPLKEIVDGIHAQVAKIEDDLKVRVSEYNNIRSQLNAINRKQTGSLAVRDLSNLVKPEDIITSEHLTTLLAIVSKYSQKDWLSSYETLTSYVVPRSSKKLYEDNEYALYTVTLFSRVADNFRTSAREKGFQVNKRRPYHSINFVIAHDGFSLRDLVSYNFKHNEANGEGGNDGCNDNFSWNCGFEVRLQSIFHSHQLSFTAACLLRMP